MLSVLIEARSDEEALARTLASLVGAAVEGVVREVIVCVLGSSDQTRHVAEHAGCRLVPDLGSAVRQAKSEWLLLLEPGARLAEGWTEAVVEHVSRSTEAARFSRPPRGLPGLFTRLFSSGSALSTGLLITRGQAQTLAPKENAAAMARAVKARRLAAEIRLAGR